LGVGSIRQGREQFTPLPVSGERSTRMKVEIRVFATLRKYLPELGVGEPKILELPEGTTFDALREQLGLPAAEVKVIMRNGVQASPEDLIADGDRIAYIPAVAGG